MYGMMKSSELINITMIAMLSDDRDRLFEYIWKKYRKRLLYYIMAVMRCPRDEGEDLLQEIMMKVHDNLQQYKPGRSFDAWIYAIARNHCLDFHRKIKSRRADEEYHEGIAESPDVFDAVCSIELNRVIKKSLEKLDEVDREMVYLRHFERLRYKSIGSIVNMNVNSVKTRLRAIEARLRHELKGWL